MVDVLGEPPKQRGVDGERRHRQAYRVAVGVVLRASVETKPKKPIPTSSRYPQKAKLRGW